MIMNQSSSPKVIYLNSTVLIDIGYICHTSYNQNSENT